MQKLGIAIIGVGCRFPGGVSSADSLWKLLIDGRAVGQVERLRQLRASRSNSAVEEKLAALEQAARGGDNLMPVILDAADAYATVGEISDRLRTVWGEHRELITV
jgi:methylmalonyl-CoA mutase N-terminal domain/subunit